MKWAAERMGLIAGIRLPLTPLSETRRAAVEKAMREAASCCPDRHRVGSLPVPGLRAGFAAPSSPEWPSGRRRWTGNSVTSSRVFVGSNPTSPQAGNESFHAECCDSFPCCSLWPLARHRTGRAARLDHGHYMDRHPWRAAG